jgi:hypothetical protein
VTPDEPDGGVPPPPGTTMPPTSPQPEALPHAGEPTVPPGPLADVDAPPLAAAPASTTEVDLVEAVGARVPRRERGRRDKELDQLVDDAEAAEALDAKARAKAERAEAKRAAKAEREAEEELLDPAERAERRSRRRTMVVLALTLAVGLVITAFAILGRINKDTYAITCSAREIRAEQGRGFPPWGTAPLEGPEWKPIAIPPSAECKAHDVDDLAALTDEYLKTLIEQATLRLTPRAEGAATGVAEIDATAKQLDQALLLARDPARADTRKTIERLLGDVEYWRATARLRAVTTELDAVAAQFDAASTRRPVHVSNGAAWGAVIRRATELLRAGTDGKPPAEGPANAGAPPRPPAPMGTALPVETPDAAPADPAPAVPVDAGLPSGGVLL